ncbi:MAG: DUF58 domain-containing protein [Desulfarculaceae bacterium]|nr:DUF58 domain-containing protein [Desulfarculaceae bacterium]
MRPSGYTVLIAGFLCLFALAAVFSQGLLLLFKGTAAVCAGLAVLDGIRAAGEPPPGVSRKVRYSMALDAWTEVSLEFENRENRVIRLRVHDHCPAGFETHNQPVDLTVPARMTARSPYQIRPSSRGNMTFAGIDLVVQSPMRLWLKKVFIPHTDTVKVLPDFNEIKRYSILATDNRLSRLGIRRKQRRGEGSDFHQLREYRSGDGLRQIHWNATSKYRRLISKEYQDEKDQQVVFMLDCGRRMRHEDNGRSHLDRVLNASLLLAYVASLQDDAVGFMTFAGEERWFPPRKGRDTVRRILNQVYDIQSSAEAPDYTEAASRLMTLQKRRSLVVVLTGTRDEDYENLLAAVRTLKKKHLTVLADIREEILDDTMAKGVTDFKQALQFSAVHGYLENRRRIHRVFRHQGIMTLDHTARALPSALVNEYLMIKAGGRL